MSIEQNIRRAVSEGNVAISVYTIPGFPTLTSTSSVLEKLRSSEVAMFETTIPVGQGWSDHTNTVIGNSMALAVQNGMTCEQCLDSFMGYRPNLFILYEGLFRHYPFERILENMQGKVDAVLLEWNEKEPEKYVKIADRYGVMMVQAVSPRTDPNELKTLVQLSNQFIYLIIADKTGGERFRMDEIEATVKLIKSIRDIPVCFGFGIRTPDDVRSLGRIEGGDGLMIGTKALQVLQTGFDPFASYIDQIMEASKNLKIGKR